MLNRLLLVLVLLATPIALGHASHGGVQTFIVTAHDRQTANGTVGWFAIDDRREANPSLLLEPGQRLFLHFVNAGEHDHTLVLGEPVHRTLGPVAPGNEKSASIRVPSNATGPIVYQDPAWNQRGMQGQLAVNASERRQAPGPGVLGTAVGLAGAVLQGLNGRRGSNDSVEAPARGATGTDPPRDP